MRKHTTEYQADGFVNGLSAQSLAEANRQINSVKMNTPESIKHLFASQIRSIRKESHGYLWIWYLK